MTHTAVMTSLRHSELFVSLLSSTFDSVCRCVRWSVGQSVDRQSVSWLVRQSVS